MQTLLVFWYFIFVPALALLLSGCVRGLWPIDRRQASNSSVLLTHPFPLLLTEGPLLNYDYYFCCCFIFSFSVGGFRARSTSCDWCRRRRVARSLRLQPWRRFPWTLASTRTSAQGERKGRKALNCTYIQRVSRPGSESISLLRGSSVPTLRYSHRSRPSSKGSLCWCICGRGAGVVYSGLKLMSDSSTLLWCVPAVVLFFPTF